MSTCTSVECNFDGSCEHCKDAGYTLTFDNGARLKTHKFVLRRASSRLWADIDSRQDKVLHMEDSPVAPWIIILRELYPGTHTFFLNKIMEEYDEILDQVAKEAHKYEITIMLNTIDDFISWRIRETTSSCNAEKIKSCAQRLKHYIKLTSIYDLKRSKQASTNFLSTALRQREDDHMSDPMSHIVNSPRGAALKECIEIVETCNDKGRWFADLSHAIINDVLRLQSNRP